MIPLFGANSATSIFTCGTFEQTLTQSWPSWLLIIGNGGVLIANRTIPLRAYTFGDIDPQYEPTAALNGDTG